jgi:hypothetical protein
VEKYKDKKVKVYFYDNPNHVTCKSGILKDFSTTFVSLDTGFSTELIAINKIVRIEVLE